MITDQEAFKALCRLRFAAFASKGFQILEPGNPLEHTWHIDCIAEHLQAQYEGDSELQWLIINEPPRCLKSVEVAQLYPAWGMGKDPSHQYIGASYAHSLAERNVMKCRQLIQSEFYRDLFPATQISADMNKKDYFTTTMNGQYKGTGIGGTITGFGCFSGETQVITDQGFMRIDDIKIGVNANHCLSFNHNSNTLEWRKIEASRTILSDDIYEIRTKSGQSFRCTGNHPIYVESKGYIEAKNLKENEVLVKAYASKNDSIGLQLLSEKLRVNFPRTRKEEKKRPREVLVQREVLLDGEKQILGCDKILRRVWKRLFPRTKEKLQYAVLQQGMWASIFEKSFKENLSGMLQSVYSPLIQNQILQPSLCGHTPLKENDWIGKFQIQGRDFLRKKIQANEVSCPREGQSFLRGLWKGWENYARKSPNQQNQNQFNGASYRREALEQCDRKPSGFMRRLSYFSPQEDTVVMVRRICTQEIPVYDLQIEGNNNFFADGILVHNCKTLIIDDPLNPKEAVSDTIRLSAIEEIRSTLFSRFNKYSEGRMVLIMQRLHDADPTGDLLKDGGYYHLKLPAYATRRVQIDLRGTTWAMEEGDYLSPRLDKKVLDKLRIDLGEYHFSGQYMQEPVPIGGGEFKPEWVMRYAQGAIKPKEMNVVILVDPAGGEELNKRKKKLSDWTAMMVVGLGTDNNYYLLDAIRDRLNPTDRINTLFMLHRKWNALCGKPPKVGYEKYGMMTDTHYIEEKKRTDAYNFNLIELGGSMMKEERIRRLIPDMQNSRWYFPDSLVYVDNEGRKFDLVQEILTSEMTTFPRARFDDCLDALSRIYTDDLFMVFPKPKIGMLEKALRPQKVSGSWEDF